MTEAQEAIETNQEPTAPKRGPKKKGNSTWKPAQKLEVRNKKKGFRYRWCDKDPANIQKKLAEGWVVATKDSGTKADHVVPGVTGDGKAPTSVTEYRESVLMVLPEEVAQARDRFFQEQTDKQTTGLKDRLQADLDQSADTEGGFRTRAHGKLVIE